MMVLFKPISLYTFHACILECTVRQVFESSTFPVLCAVTTLIVLEFVRGWENYVILGSMLDNGRIRQ
jgi:hypothetical protein